MRVLQGPVKPSGASGRFRGGPLLAAPCGDCFGGVSAPLVSAGFGVGGRRGGTMTGGGGGADKTSK